MVTTVFSPDSLPAIDPAPVTGPASRSGKASAPPASSDAGLDDQLLPLRIPALVVGVVLICLGLAALGWLNAWVRDYGGILVVLAYVQYMTLASALEIWGLRMSRNSSGSHAQGSPAAQHRGPPIEARGSQPRDSMPDFVDDGLRTHLQNSLQDHPGYRHVRHVPRQCDHRVRCGTATFLEQIDERWWKHSAVRRRFMEHGTQLVAEQAGSSPQRVVTRIAVAITDQVIAQVPVGKR
ncbi:hypothetical protein ACQP1G_42395 [Nocardia sp. CA-107356]|uniref:hypothetical protein n=1 Tax=Nocardia sp. CA-107356 TaxID=3239972 RepID=UPI003D8A71FB